MECALVVQAVAVASFGPLAPKRMETCPAARFTMAAGMKNGEILRGPPFEQRRVLALDDVESADAGADVHADAFGVLGRDLQAADIFIASSAAAMAKWMKRPIFLISFFSMKFSGSKFLTSAAIWQANGAEASNWRDACPTPLLPASRFFQTSSVVLPTPQIRPIPVTTTRRRQTYLPPFACFPM